MIVRRFVGLVIVVFAFAADTGLSVGNSSAAAEVSFQLGPAPSWVKRIEAADEIAAGAGDLGMVYLLADRQEHLNGDAFYYREVRKILSQKGLERGRPFLRDSIRGTRN